MSKMDVIKRLKEISASSICKKRMPSIKRIHETLDEYGIRHIFRDTTNIVEYRSAGKRYVNSRHEGKCGYSIEINNDDGTRFEMDTSDSYYSWNKWTYAERLLKIIKEAKK